MTHQLYSVEDVAQRLGMHVKTIRRYIQEGRLKAKRIGKEYRIAQQDLDALAGTALTPTHEVVRTRHVVVSSIVDITAISRADSDRITTMVMASLNMRRGEPDVARADTIYYEEAAKLRVTITAALEPTCELLKMIDVLLANGR